MRYSLPAQRRFAVIILAAFLMVSAGAVQKDHEDLSDTEKYGAMPRPEFVRAMQALTEERGTRHRQLIDVLGQKGAKQQIIAAIYILGLDRVNEAAPVLAGMIDFKDENTGPYDQLPLWGDRPALGALINIGSPARQPLVDNLAVSDVATVRELSMKGLLQIYGAPCVNLILQHAAAGKSLDARQLARLKDAMLLCQSMGRT